MNVYVETNFVLELALLQEQQESCRAILELAAARRVQLVIPAYCLVEPYETLSRRHRERKQLKTGLDEELRQLARSLPNANLLEGFPQITAILIDSADEEVKRLQATREEICAVGDVIPLDIEVLRAAGVGRRFGLTAQDALVFASVTRHLARSTAPAGSPSRSRDGERSQPSIGHGAEASAPSCFLTRDADFEDPDIVRELQSAGCRLISDFGHGLKHVTSMLPSEGGP